MEQKETELKIIERPKVEYNYNLNEANVIGAENRRTINGMEKTLTILLPPRGCKYKCDFCSLKNIKNPNFQVIPEDAERATKDVDSILKENPDANVVKLFNAGNVLYGTIEGSRGELHECFWEIFPSILENYPKLKAVEIEVRVDEFVDGDLLRAEQKQKIQSTIKRLSQELKAIGKELRVILPLEYVDSKIIAEQKKFHRAFFPDQETAQHNNEVAIQFMRDNEIPWLSYSMLGGRLEDRSLTPDEAVNSAANTALFSLEQGAQEAIVNSLYLDPINQWEDLVSKDKDGNPIKHYVPTQTDMLKLLKIVTPHLGTNRRLRLSTDKEDIIKGTIGPEVSNDFRGLVLDFNNAEDQKKFF